MKFISVEYDPDYFPDSDYIKVDNPTKYNDKYLPDGEYLVRGNSKGKRQEYIKRLGQWWKPERGGSGYNYTYWMEYRLFPQLQHYEYVRLYHVKDKLNDLWKKHVDAYFLWMELHELSRLSKKNEIRFKKLYGY